MKKRTGIIVEAVVGIVLCIGLWAIVTHADAVDNVVLLERQHPKYWNYLSPEAVTTRSVPASFFNGDRSANLLAPNWKETTEQGMTATVNDDGSVTVTGSNTGNAFNLATTGINLPEGQYIYTNNKEGTDFINASGVWMYVWQGNAKATLQTLPEFDVSVDESYHTGIHIDAGATNINVTFYPMIRVVSTETDGYKQFDEEKVEVNEYRIDGQITEDDLKIFLNGLERETSTSVIDLSNGYGIQFQDSEISYGTIDAFGLVGDVQRRLSSEEIYEVILDSNSSYEGSSAWQ